MSNITDTAITLSRNYDEDDKGCVDDDDDDYYYCQENPLYGLPGRFGNQFLICSMTQSGKISLLD